MDSPSHIHSIPPFYSNTSITNPSPFYLSSIPPFYSTYNTNTTPSPNQFYPIEASTPNLSFSHNYSPPSSYYNLHGSENTEYSSYYHSSDYPIFYGNEDAYWWILCTEKYFKIRRTSYVDKMTVAAMAMRGEALKWWLWWSKCHPHLGWDDFTTHFLWQFKPEYREILSIPDRKELEESDSVSQISVVEENEKQQDEEAKSELLTVESFFVQEDLIEEERDEQPNEAEPDSEFLTLEDKEEYEHQKNLNLEPFSPHAELRDLLSATTTTIVKYPSKSSDVNDDGSFEIPPPKPPERVSISPSLPQLKPSDRSFNTTVEAKKSKYLVLKLPPLKPAEIISPIALPPLPPKPPEPPDQNFLAVAVETPLTTTPPFVLLHVRQLQGKILLFDFPPVLLRPTKLYFPPFDSQQIFEIQSQLLASSTILVLPCDSPLACHVSSYLFTLKSTPTVEASCMRLNQSLPILMHRLSLLSHVHLIEVLSVSHEMQHYQRIGTLLPIDFLQKPSNIVFYSLLVIWHWSILNIYSLLSSMLQVFNEQIFPIKWSLSQHLATNPPIQYFHSYVLNFGLAKTTVASVETIFIGFAFSTKRAQTLGSMQQREPGGNFLVFKVANCSQLKQWDPGGYLGG